MSRLNLLVLVGVLTIGYSASLTHIGKVLEGNSVLMVKRVQWDAAGEKSHLRVHFPGKIITCIILRVPFIREEKFFDLEVVEGGIFSDFVDLKVHWLGFLKIPLRVQIYGMGVESGSDTGKVVDHHVVSKKGHH